jgi:hypothetical protein
MPKLKPKTGSKPRPKHKPKPKPFFKLEGEGFGHKFMQTPPQAEKRLRPKPRYIG